MDAKTYFCVYPINEREVKEVLVTTDSIDSAYTICREKLNAPVYFFVLFPIPSTHRKVQESIIESETIRAFNEYEKIYIQKGYNNI